MSCKLKVKHDAGHNLDSGKTLQNIYCLWTNMAEIWPAYFQINFLKNRSENFEFFFQCWLFFPKLRWRFVIPSFICLYTVSKEETTGQKSETQFISQTCEEANAILIDLFSLYAKLQQIHHVTACVKQFYSI